MNKIKFHFQENCTLKHRNKLKAFLIEKCLAHHFEIASIDIIFVSDAYLLDINNRHLSHDYFTDIITFDNSTELTQIISEIYISVDRIKENASLYKTTIINELHRVIFHGLLHLLQFDDTTEESKKQMTAMENQWLKDFQSFTLAV